jgi:hypothetical protein
MGTDPINRFFLEPHPALHFRKNLDKFSLANHLIRMVFIVEQVVGTHRVIVHVLDNLGNCVQRHLPHSASVDDNTIDPAGDFVATASADGMLTRIFSCDVRHY